MAKDLRKILRKKHGFGAGPFGITAVHSTEGRVWPRELTYDGGAGFRCVCPNRSDEHSCESRAVVDGTAAFVTGTFGLMAASVVVNRLVDAVFRSSRPAMDRFGWRPEQ
jgi:tRNA A37 threonylcarbamoyladenosine dehydratase